MAISSSFVRDFKTVSTVSASLLVCTLFSKAEPPASPSVGPGTHRIETIARAASPTLTSSTVPFGEPLLRLTVLPGNDSPEGLVWVETSGRQHEVKVKLADPHTRLALMEANSPSADTFTSSGAAPVILPGSTDALKIGQKLQALAAEPRSVLFAGKVKQWEGNVSPVRLLRLHFDGSGLIPGTPIIDGEGKLTGLVLHPVAAESGVCLAVPVEAASKLLSDLQAGRKTVSTGKLEIGINPQNSTPRIEFIGPGSRAEAAGLKVGDILLELGGRSVAESLDVVEANYFLPAQQQVEAKVLRGMTELSLQLPPTD